MSLKDKVEEYIAKVYGTKVTCTEMHPSKKDDRYYVATFKGNDGFVATWLVPLSRTANYVH